MSTELELQQAALVAALTGTGPSPAGFDPVRLEVARQALLRKRAGEVARSWPMLRAALGAGFLPAFSDWAEHRPTGGGWPDGFAFAAALAERGALPGPARAEWRRCRLQWAMRDGALRRRRLPAVAVVDGRLLVQIGGRVAGWGPPG